MKALVLEGRLLVKEGEMILSDQPNAQGKRVRITIQSIEDNESFEELMDTEELATEEDIWP